MVFCTEDEVPTLGTLLNWASHRGVVFTGQPSASPWTPDELEVRHWQGFGLWYDPDHGPLEVHVHHTDGPEGHFTSNLNWYREGVAELPPSPQRDKVLAHLMRTRFIVALNLPVSGLDTEELWQAAWVLLDYFLKYSNGLVHIEDDGFYYERDTLFLELTEF